MYVHVIIIGSIRHGLKVVSLSVILLARGSLWKVCEGYEQPLTTFNGFEGEKEQRREKNYPIKYSRNFND